MEENRRKWVKSALQKELPGLRGFSATSIKKMRYFYEEWADLINRPPLAVDLQLNKNNVVVKR
jgi:hypothetical protein